MRKLFIVLAVIVGLLVIAVAALPFVLDVNKYRPRIQSELQKRTGRQVTLGKMDLKIFPLAFRVDNATIFDDPAFHSSKPFAQTQNLLVSAKLWPLLHGDVEVDSISLEKPKIELIRSADGVWNFSTIGKQAPPPSSPRPAQKTEPPASTSTKPEQPQQPEQASTGKQFSLAELVINDGEVAVTDFQKKQPRAVYDHIDLTLRDYTPNSPVKIDLAAHLPGSGKQEIRLEGSGGPMNSADPMSTDFSGNLKLTEVSLGGIQKFLNAQALNGVEFTASGETSVTNKQGQLKSDGKLTLTNGDVHGVKIDYPVSADYNVSADLKNDVYRIEKGEIKLGGTPISVSGTMNAGPTPAQLDMRVKADNASISEMARLASAFGVAFNPGMTIAGKVDADITAQGAASHPAMNGKVNANELVITGKDLPQAVHVTSVALELAPETVKSNEFVATTGSTAVKVSFALNGYAGDRPAIDANVHTNGAQLGELINIAQAYGVSAAEGMKGTGSVNIDLHAQGAMKDPNSFQYSGDGQLINGTLSLPTLTQPVRISTATLRFTQNSATLDNLRFGVGSTNADGQLTLKGLAPNAVPSAQFTLSVDKFDVAEWQKLMANAPVATKTTSISSILPVAYAAPPAAPSMLERLTGGGNITAGTVIYDQLVMNNAKGTVTLDHGLIKLSPVTAQVYGGTQSGTIVVDTRPTPSTYTVATKLDHVDANQLMSSLSGIKKTLYGLLAANADTRFTASQSTDAAKTLNGTVNLNLQNGKLAGIDLLNELASIGKFAGLKASEPFTNIAKLTGDFDIKNGVATTNNLKAVIDGGTLSANGLVNLATQTLDMQMTAVLSKDYSQSVGGTGVGGYLTTALANKNGELVMPVLLSGSLTSPKVVPDVKTIARMKLENVVPSVGGILQSITGKNQPGNSGQSPMQGILDALKGKQSSNTDQNNNGQKAAPVPESDQMPDPSKPKTDQPKADQQNQQQQQANPLGDLVNQIVNKNKKKKTTDQQQQTPPKSDQPK
jgi:uncharacterized protein involved in outer membrane biogenesis